MGYWSAVDVWVIGQQVMYGLHQVTECLSYMLYII